MSKQADVDATCQGIYREARDFFKQYKQYPKYLGYGILQGPPLFQPPILIIGLQPGNRSGDDLRERERGSEERWPPTCNNANGTWKLSRKLQYMFQPPLPRLEKCVGINAIFARSKNTNAYKNDFDIADRAKIKEFCLQQVQRIIDVIDPRTIAVIGLKTAELFSLDWKVDLLTRRGDTLTQRGQIAGRPAIAMRHLTGSRPPVSDSDLDRIRDRLRNFAFVNVRQ